VLDEPNANLDGDGEAALLRAIRDAKARGAIVILITHRAGMLSNDVVWRTLGRATALRGRQPATPLLLLTTALPKRGSDGDAALRAAGPGLVFDVVELGSPTALERLAGAAHDGPGGGPRPGFWSPADL